MTVILVDCDGVLFDFANAVIREFWKHGVSDYTEEHFQDHQISTALDKGHKKLFDKMAFSPEWCANIPRYPGAQGFLKTLTLRGHVHLVTAPYVGPYWPQAREEAVESLLSFKGGDKISFEWCPAETRHCEPGDILIEDRADTAGRWAKTGRKAILMDRPWNRLDGHVPGMHRVKSYTEALNAVIS